MRVQHLTTASRGVFRRGDMFFTNQPPGGNLTNPVWGISLYFRKSIYPRGKVKESMLADRKGNGGGGMTVIQQQTIFLFLNYIIHLFCMKGALPGFMFASLLLLPRPRRYSMLLYLRGVGCEKICYTQPSYLSSAVTVAKPASVAAVRVHNNLFLAA